jgi:hypothetical protein
MIILSIQTCIFDVKYSCVYFLSNDLAAWNLHGIVMSLLCRLLDAGFIWTKFYQRYKPTAA